MNKSDHYTPPWQERPEVGAADPVPPYFLVIPLTLMSVNFLVDMSYFAVSMCMLQLTLTYLEYLRMSVSEVRMRNRLELAAEMWPSEQSDQVVDLKYLACTHQYIIRYEKDGNLILFMFEILKILKKLIFRKIPLKELIAV